MAVKLTVNLHDEVADALVSLADERGVPFADVVCSAVSTEGWLQRRSNEGCLFLLEDSDGVLSDLSWRAGSASEVSR